jgi:hypothetical protein
VEKSEIRAGVLRNLIEPTQHGGECFLTLGGKEVTVKFFRSGTWEIHIPNKGDGKVISGRIVVEID